MNFLLSYCILSAVLIGYGFCQTESVVDPRSLRPYCFQFTWLGPKWGEHSDFLNATCEDVIGTSKVPCISPLIATNNSNIPDTEYMWEELDRNNIGCVLNAGDVCVKFSYIYNNAVENITYMCSKVTIQDEDAVTSGCFSEFQDGREIEVCVCESSVEGGPCNSANNIIWTSVKQQYFTWTMIILVYILIYFKHNLF